MFQQEGDILFPSLWDIVGRENTIDSSASSHQLWQCWDVNGRSKTESRNNPGIVPAQADTITGFDLAGKNSMQMLK